MQTSQFFIPTTRETPAGASIMSHQLMLRAGMIRPLASGLYTWLPLGLRVMRKVETIVREAMNRVGAQELLMPIVQPAQLWEQSERWQQYGPELLRIADRHDNAFCLGPTHEEVITNLISHNVSSYKQLPITFYQIQTKFRDEIRPRFGIMRAREFMMKDAYSFHDNQASLQATYDAMHEAYTRIFTRLGLDFRSVIADSGAIGGAISREFHVLAETGEDAIAFSDSSDFAANVETLAEGTKTGDPSPDGKGYLTIKRGIEVGHIFQLGTKYSAALNATVLNEAGQQQPVIMGTYGIGISRIVAASIEQNHDDKGILWNDAMAPFQIVIIPINMHKSAAVAAQANQLHQQLVEQGYEVLMDNHNEQPGVKFANADLIGIPHRIVISERNLQAEAVEYKKRDDSHSQQIPLTNVISYLATQLHSA